MRRIAILFILFASLSFSCTKKVTVVSPADALPTLSPHGMVYTLPLSTFRIRIESTHYHTIPGPYAPFSERFLGVSDVPLKAKSEWSFSAVDVFPENEVDQSSIFVVEPGDDFQADFLQLTRMGLVIPITSATFQGSNQIGFQPDIPYNTPAFNDLSPTPFIAAERTTHYSRVFQDSTFVRVPVHKTIIVEKSIEDKAREAAEFIFSLRKRRFELLAGDADFVAEGKAVETVLQEINRLENEYLSLFIGKMYENKSEHWFDYTPRPNGDGATILFRFSPTKGVVSASDLSGSPVLITTSSEQTWQSTSLLNELSSEKGQPRTDAVYYRIPVPINLKISFGNTELFSKRIAAYQFGPLVRIPARFLIREANSFHVLPTKK